MRASVTHLSLPVRAPQPSVAPPALPVAPAPTVDAYSQVRGPNALCGVAPAQAITVRGITITLQDVARWAPVVHFHPHERFLPCGIAPLLQKATLVDGAGATLATQVSAETLQRYVQSENRLHLHADAFAGEPVVDGRIVAPMYVGLQVPATASYVELNYILLFAYNGPQLARVSCFGRAQDCALPQFGEHEGDVEGICLRLSPDLRTVLQVRYEAHGAATVYRPEQVAFEGTHPRVLCALGTHGTYNPRAYQGKEWIVTEPHKHLGVRVDFADYVSHQGPVWRPYDSDAQGGARPNGQLVLVGLDGHGRGINQQGWTAFAGTIGRRFRARAQGVRRIDGGPVAPLTRVGLNAIEMLVTQWLPKHFPLMERHWDSNGTLGLGARPWMCLEPPA